MDTHFVNPEISWPEYRQRYAEIGRVQVLDFLAPQAAHEVSALAKSALPWTLEYRDAGQSRRISELDLKAMAQLRAVPPPMLR